MKGTRNKPQTWITNYHYSSPAGNAHRRGGDYTLAIIERSAPGKEVLIVPKQSGVLAKLAEATQADPTDTKAWFLRGAITGPKT